jgi:uncharacterized Zn finger protein
MRDNRAMARIEVTEESIRELVGPDVFARGAHLAPLVSGLSVAGTLVEAVVDGVRVTARLRPPVSANRNGNGPSTQCGLDERCACGEPAPCPHAVAALLAWVRTGAAEGADEISSLRADFEDALADDELDLDYLDELVDDIEELLEEDPGAIRDLSDRVMNLLEARQDVDVTDLLERVEELYLEARQLAAPAG